MFEDSDVGDNDFEKNLKVTIQNAETFNLS